MNIGFPMEQLEKGPKELKRFADLQAEQKYEPTSNPSTNHQPKSTHGGTHGSSYICSRRWPFQKSMRGETMGAMKA